MLGVILFFSTLSDIGQNALNYFVWLTRDVLYSTTSSFPPFRPCTRNSTHQYNHYMTMILASYFIYLSVTNENMIIKTSNERIGAKKNEPISEAAIRVSRLRAKRRTKDRQKKKKINILFVILLINANNL